MKYESMLCRKVIAAAGTSLILSFIFASSLIKEADPNVFGWAMVILMYSGPVILIYGTVSSFISDLIAGFIAKKTSSKFQRIYSFVFHILFGFVLAWISLIAAVIFFVLDFLLDKWKSVYRIKHAAIGLVVPVGCWLIFILIFNLMG